MPFLNRAAGGVRAHAVLTLCVILSGMARGMLRLEVLGGRIYCAFKHTIDIFIRRSLI